MTVANQLSTEVFERIHAQNAQRQANNAVSFNFTATEVLWAAQEVMELICGPQNVTKFDLMLTDLLAWYAAEKELHDKRRQSAK